jgi:hypothetical protein
VFILDEISDNQNGEDALSTGDIFYNNMIDYDWEDGTALGMITKEYLGPFHLCVS